MQVSLSRRCAAEILGSALLLATVVGSGIMADRLAMGNVAIALLANAIATGAVLVALILTFKSTSAHFNPVVTIVDALWGGTARRDVPFYLVCQFGGAFLGVAVAHIMFGLPVFLVSTHTRSGGAQIFSEFVATFGLMAVIVGCWRRRSDSIAYAVGAYIVGAYWFTASTSFANPAVTLARAATDTFSGIRPLDVTGFVIAQLGGALAAGGLMRWMLPDALQEKA